MSATGHVPSAIVCDSDGCKDGGGLDVVAPSASEPMTAVLDAAADVVAPSPLDVVAPLAA